MTHIGIVGNGFVTETHADAFTDRTNLETTPYRSVDDRLERRRRRRSGLRVTAFNGPALNEPVHLDYL